MVEFDAPYTLLQKKESHLARLAANVEEQGYASLVAMARKHFFEARQGQDVQQGGKQEEAKQGDEKDPGMDGGSRDETKAAQIHRAIVSIV